MAHSRQVQYKLDQIFGKNLRNNVRNRTASLKIITSYEQNTKIMSSLANTDHLQRIRKWTDI